MHLSMLIAVKPLATVPNGPRKVHKARLQALQRPLGTRSDGDIAKVPYRITVEVIQRMLTHLRPHRFSAMYDMNHSTGLDLPALYTGGPSEAARKDSCARLSVLCGVWV